MKRTQLDRNMLTVEKFLDAAIEADLAVMLESYGINIDRLIELETLLGDVKQRRLESDMQTALQKDRTARKAKQKRALQSEIVRLSDLIRSMYPQATWLSQLGLETRFQTVNRSSDGNEGESVKRATRSSRSEAAFRGKCHVLLENLDDLKPEVLESLSSRGWTAERIAAAKTLFADFVRICEERDSYLRISRQKSAELAEAIHALSSRYRSYARQVRIEAGHDPQSKKLTAATQSWS